MDVYTAILNRRSIRKFTSEQVSDETLKMILNAGFHAPTAGNKRPVHFIVVKDNMIKEALSKSKLEVDMIKDCDVAIVVCGDKNIQPYHDFLHEDCAASIENMLLCVHGCGLGAVWCGVPEILPDCLQVYIEKLNLPDNIIPVGTIAIGGTGEKKSYINRFDVKKVHYDCW